MFTGIIQGIARISGIARKPGLISVQIEFPQTALDKIALGASVAIDGVCLTVTNINGSMLAFDVMTESLDRTTLGSLKEGSKVNFERSLTFGQELGGHLISGHVDDAAEIIKIETPENNHVITFSAAQKWMPYIFPKGYIALGGASLTVATTDREKNSFTVYLIPETLRRTTFGKKKKGDRINFEIERQTQVIVDTVNRFMEGKLAEQRGKSSS